VNRLDLKGVENCLFITEAFGLSWLSLSAICDVDRKSKQQAYAKNVADELFLEPLIKHAPRSTSTPDP
jgi:hypothetical protein